MTISELCAELNNWFERGVKSGTFEISGGILDVDFLLNGQYFRIVGSDFNDGVYMFPDEQLTDETFSGEIWAMAVPPDVISLLDRINDWVDKYSTAIDSPYVSESFGGYSGSKYTNGNGGAITLRDKFRTELNKYRKV